jgi:hypothetical protein
MGGDRPDSPSRGEADKFRVHWSAVSPGHAANGGLGKEKARNCAARGYATVTDTLLVQMRLKVSTIRSHGPGNKPEDDIASKLPLGYDCQALDWNCQFTESRQSRIG